ncbi:tetratricopeptide repeat protein [Nostoc sp. FACHB-87]|uniref:tetratricopeptide repeat protein n=1 Tax=Nostocaceae TaxID=1162 RepID=UPI001683F1BB|nr:MULTISPECIES: tetratricopeptide repeat protein [Nostocaceae]MBD2457083.1 tetratricopeptide repeat protein [Nostoc sp. FACHB-87]MBD2478269.1 tetratricopeptide repeat protein [Anabaena sp. FACHB-83]
MSAGLPKELNNRCRQVLLQCDEFKDYETLIAVFVTDELLPFKYEIRKANNPKQLVNFCIADLIEKLTDRGESVLAILLATLRDKYHPGDRQYSELSELYETVKNAIEKLSQSTSTFNQEKCVEKRVVGLEEIPEIAVWQGRTQLIDKLKTKLLQPGEQPNYTNILPKVIALLGQGGIGKTSLAVKLLESVGVTFKPPSLASESPYDGVIFFRVKEGSRFDEIAQFFFNALEIEAAELANNAQEKINIILTKLLHQRFLILIDEPEVMLHSASHPLAGYATCEEFGVLLNDLTYKNHQSQIIITCREKPSNLADSRYEGSQPDSELVHLETLGGVSIESGIKILQQRHLTDSDEDLEWIAQSVDGHVFLLTQLAAIAKGKPGYLRKHPELVTKNAAKLLKVQFERQSEEGRELLQRICILRKPINIKGLTFLRLYTEDWIKEDCLIKPCELEKKYKTSDVEIDKTELIITRLVDNCLVESYYDEQECEHYYGLHRVIKEFLQKELINNLPALLQRVYCYYKAAKNIYDNPKNIEELYPCLEAQYLYFYLGDYFEAYKLLNSNAKKYLKRWGYWHLLQELYEKNLPYLSGFELSECLHSLGEIYFDFGNWELAEKCFNMALSIATEQGYENLEEMSTLSLKLIDNERQSWDLEEQSYQLRMQSQHENYDQGRMQDFCQFLDDYNRQAWGVKAESYKKQLQFYAESPSFPDLEINITETTGNLGEAEFYMGNFESAEKILEEALAKMQELCMVKHIALTNYRLAKLKHRCSNIKMAESHYNIACQIYLNLGALKELEKIEREWRRM